MMILDERRIQFLNSTGHALVTGGPGSGKTTIAIIKASKIVDSCSLKQEQRIIFLSFARSTISRVFQAIQENQNSLSKDSQAGIEVETYHSFFWSILKTHGYLIGLPKRLRILPKPEEAIKLSNVRSAFPKQKRTQDQQTALEAAVNVEKRRLAFEEGYICFDQFVEIARELVLNSPRIRSLIMDKYPVIILDEFQDTSDEHWSVIQQLGEKSALIALADPDQRIYDFLGADPNRLDHFRKAFLPNEFSFSGDNFRSQGTDIINFGRDLLAHQNVGRVYNDVVIHTFPSVKAQAYHRLKLLTIQARQRLLAQGKPDWSIAVLVPTKILMKSVSQLFGSHDYLNATIEHTNAVSKEGPVLSSYIIARLMQPGDPRECLNDTLVLLENYYRGRAGERITQGNINAAEKIKKSVSDIDAFFVGTKKLSKSSIAFKLKAVIEIASSVEKIGDPLKDWLLVRQSLENSFSTHFKEVATHAKELQLLGRGAELRAMLSEDWLRNGDYVHALEIVERSFVQEHFAKGSKPETGVIVMNMHKSKGKQFDEVIIFEDWYHIVDGNVVNPGNRIFRPGSVGRQAEQARYNLYVSATQAKQRTSILTPAAQICEFLV